MSGKYEIKEQMIEEDADFEKSGRVRNRVIEWGRDGITIRNGSEARQGDIEGSSVGTSESRCDSMRRGKDAKSDESEEETRREQGQSHTKHEWDSMNDDDDMDRRQMAGADSNKSQALTSEHITRNRAFVSYLW